QSYGKFAVFTNLAVHSNAATMLLGDYVVGDRQTEAGTLARRLGCEERLKQLVPDLERDTDTIVAHGDLGRIAQVTGRDLERGFEVRRHLCGLPFTDRVERV